MHLEEENVDIEWSRLMRFKPPALENASVKEEMQPEVVDDSKVDSKVSPTLELDY